MTTFFRLTTAIALAITLAAPVYAAKNDLPIDGRIKLLQYDPNDIYTLYTRVGYQSYVEFAQAEEIETISVGDRSFWQIIPSGSRLFVRPLQSNTATNMTVITNRRSYQFDLKSSNDKDENDIRVTYVARFTYPESQRKSGSSDVITELFAPTPPPVVLEQPARTSEASRVVSQAQPVTLTPPPPIATAKKNYSYTYSGSDRIAPYEVFDDGMNTYIRYQRPPSFVPAVTMVASNGKETPVYTARQGDYLVAEIVAPKLALRSGDDTIYIYNELLSPAP